jgi:glycosyltransferase involved in cell wall biosynthesis
MCKDMKKVKVLHCLNAIKSGGAETFIMNLYRNIDSENIEFDFAVREKTCNEYTKEIKRRGGRIYCFPNFPRHFINNYIMMDKFLKETKYDVIHIHANSFLYFYPLVLGHKYGVKKIIFHSHNTRPAKKIYKVVHLINRKLFDRYITERIACSEAAGKWMYGEKKYTVIPNAIDADKYRYDEIIRKELRHRYNLEGKIVVGSVGRLELQKNCEFIIDVFNEFQKNENNSVLLMIGEGSLKGKLKNKVRKYGISDKVKFLGRRDDVNKLLQVMDIFIMPSLFEGLPFSLIEAQAAGCQCFVSDKISDEAIITECVESISIDNGTEQWVKKMVEFAHNSQHTDTYHIDTYDRICQEGFAIKKMSKRMEEDFYKIS